MAKVDLEKFICSLMRKQSEFNWLYYIMRSALKDQGLEYKDGSIVENELKRAPKFKVGDWVIGRATSNEPRQISEITDQYYKSTYGGQYGFSFEDEMRLWTIQDAKDGDVLADADNVGVILFRKIGNEKYANVVDYHCVVYTRGEFGIQKGVYYYGESKDEKLHPATKEQRELLFQKMKEAGYEWDADKKELKKIEQKPAEKCSPSLKKSEDEKIRKSASAYFAKFKPNDMWDADFSFGDIVAWFEKQGEKDEEILILKDQIESLHAAIKAVKETHRIELEKRDEQKLVKCNMEWYDFVRWFVKERTDNYTLIPSNTDIYTWGGIILEHAKKELKKQSEQNLANSCKTCKDGQESADKVAPKFKVGDWVVNTITNDVEQIIEVTSNEYICSGVLIVSFDNQHLLKKWTIQDAKEGDVLSYVTDKEDLWIMIYWSLYEPYEGHVHYHALLVNDNFGDKGTCCICIDNLKPATKEQSNLLFSKMKEAGYEWDAKKKVLKKIEQKPAETEKGTNGNKR